jgi:cell division protein FtsL
LERKYLESNQKIQEYVNKYRKEKSRAANLQKQVDELTRQARMDIQTIKEHQKQIQKLQEVCFHILHYKLFMQIR